MLLDLIGKGEDRNINTIPQKNFLRWYICLLSFDLKIMVQKSLALNEPSPFIYETIIAKRVEAIYTNE